MEDLLDYFLFTICIGFMVFGVKAYFLYINGEMLSLHSIFGSSEAMLTYAFLALAATIEITKIHSYFSIYKSILLFANQIMLMICLIIFSSSSNLSKCIEELCKKHTDDTGIISLGFGLTIMSIALFSKFMRQIEPKQ